MCYNCGCSNPQDDMGSQDNITESTFEHLAKHWNKPIKETKSIVYKMLQEGKIDDSHLVEMFEKAAKAWGQSIDEAKMSTQRLLKNQLEDSK
jgi:hypothetical protein